MTLYLIIMVECICFLIVAQKICCVLKKNTAHKTHLCRIAHHNTVLYVIWAKQDAIYNTAMASVTTKTKSWLSFCWFIADYILWYKKHLCKGYQVSEKRKVKTWIGYSFKTESVSEIMMHSGIVSSHCGLKYVVVCVWRVWGGRGRGI